MVDDFSARSRPKVTSCMRQVPSALGSHQLSRFLVDLGGPLGVVLALGGWRCAGRIAHRRRAAGRPATGPSVFGRLAPQLVGRSLPRDADQAHLVGAAGPTRSPFPAGSRDCRSTPTAPSVRAAGERGDAAVDRMVFGPPIIGVGTATSAPPTIARIPHRARTDALRNRSADADRKEARRSGPDRPAAPAGTRLGDAPTTRTGHSAQPWS